jgi:DNA-directed RNA polymerase subunit K/omega
MPFDGVKRGVYSTPRFLLSNGGLNCTMNFEYLTQAEEKIGNIPTLVNLVSYRTRQLIRGERPMVKRDFPEQDNHDVVLKEIVEGKLTVEMGVQPVDMNPSFDMFDEGPDIVL